MTARAAMIMRATIEEASFTDDEWGQPGPPIWADKFGELVPCFTWASSRAEAVRAEVTVTVVETRMMIPLGFDVTEIDRVLMVQNRLGEMLFPGPQNIRSVEYKKDHWELLLESEAG